MSAGLFRAVQTASVQGAFLAIAQAALVFALLYPFYRIRGIGAGDVKLLMVMGCFLQGQRLFDYIAVMMALAGAASILKMLCVQEGRQRLVYLGRYLRKVAVTGAVDEYEIDASQKKSVIRLSIPALLSLLLMYAGIY